MLKVMIMEFKISSLTEEENKILSDELSRLKKSVDEKSLNKLCEVVSVLEKFNLSLNVYLSQFYLFKIEKGLVLLDDIEFENDDIKELTEKVYGLEQFNFNSYQDEAENIYKVFLSLAENITVVIMVLSKMLVRLRHLNDEDGERRKLLCSFAKEIYAPLAARLGFADIKGEMEDICLKEFNPKAYFELKEMLDKYWPETFDMLLKIKEELTKMLDELGIEGQIFSRQKHISSVYYKMQSKQISVTEIYDFAALRVVVSTEEECYSLLGKIHSKFRPMPGRIKDYISSPKPNGYQSLHTTIIYDNDKPVEIQIRTKKMHEQNEMGVSAHYLYKEKGKKKKASDEQLLWARKLLAENKNASAIDFVESLKMDLFPGKILVQTPQGKVVELPEGACALDFAYAIHSGIGNSCSGAKVNGQFVSISTILKNNDNVEIITSPNVKGPSLGWLKFVKTSAAKKKINEYFKSKLKEENIKKGRSALEKYLQGKKLNLKDILPEITEDFLYKKFSVKNLDTLFAGIGYGSFRCEICGNRIEALYYKNHPELAQNKNITKQKKTGVNSVVIAGEKDYFYKFASCCKPIAGDEIVAVITRGRGVSIHKKDCTNLKGISAERLLEAHFDSGDSFGEMNIKISIIDSPVALSKISLVLSSLSLSVNKMEVKREDEVYVIVSVNVKNSSMFEKIEKRLSALKFVTNVKRI